MIFGQADPAFTRPAEATPNFQPRSPMLRFTSEFEPFPGSATSARMPRMPGLPAGAGPGGVAAAASAAVLPSSAPPIAQRAMGMLPPHFLMALGIQPSVQAGGGRAATDPSSLVAGGRNPGL